MQTPAISGAGVTTWAQAGNVYDTRSKYSLGTWIGTVDAAPTTTISLTGFRTGTFAVAKVSEWTGLPAVTGTFTTATQGAANPSITATIPSSCALAIAMTTLEDDLFGTAPTGGTAMTDAGTSGSSNTLSSQYSIAPAAGSITYGWTNAAGSFNGVLMLTVSAYTASSNSGTSTSSTASVILPAWNVNPGNDTIVLFVASTVSVTSRHRPAIGSWKRSRARRRAASPISKMPAPSAATAARRSVFPSRGRHPGRFRRESTRTPAWT
ncbi:MAG: hypothetical protein WDN27_04265 [Candidatus Saccharibacteria bacterium]